ncbi:hypothetical protein MD484_g3325, partial [Candolleomyces efflorescens]
MSDYNSEFNINRRGIIAARSVYANFVMTMVEVGIHVFMSLYGLSVFLETPSHLRQGRRKYIVLSFLITVFSALTGALDIAWLFQVLLKATTGSQYFDVATEYLSTWDRYVSGIGLSFVIFLGDVLLVSFPVLRRSSCTKLVEQVYRCYIIWFHRRWVAIIPALMCLASLVTSLLQGTLPYSTAYSEALATASQLLTVGTNIIVTTLITFHLLRTRRTLSKLLHPSIQSGDPRGVVLEYRDTAESRMYTRVIAILIESAFPLSLLGVAAAIFQQVPVPRNQARAEAYLVWYHLVDGLFYSFCALSPHMIIFRVTIGRSWLKSPTLQRNRDGQRGPVSVSDMQISKPIGFAHSVTRGETAEIAVTTTYSSLEESSQRSSTAEDFAVDKSSDDLQFKEKDSV